MRDGATLIAFLFASVFSASTISAWIPLRICTRSRVRSRNVLAASSEWSATDDWNNLSSENPDNGRQDYAVDQDFAQREAIRMQNWDLDSLDPTALSPEDAWLQDAIETVLLDSTITPEERLDTQDFLEDMGREIALLVRCNQSPQEMLIAAGKALPILTTEDKHNPRQLVRLEPSNQNEETEGEVVVWAATDFLKTATRVMFEQHAHNAKTGAGDTKAILDPRGVASWMKKSLREGAIGPHDPRVTFIISKFGTYGTGTLQYEDFLNLYVSTICGSSPSRWKQLEYRSEEIEAVWRDLRNHDIVSPVEQERVALLQKMKEKYEESFSHVTDETLLDECEIIDDKVASWEETSQGQWRQTGKSSHELVELAYDGKTPLRLKDGEFVFIDEDSCIGCKQCASASPASFHMLDDGRARTFAQRNSLDVKAAVAVCPVSCMHYVGFDRLKELETSRDSPDGDGRTDHRHFGQNHRNGGYIARAPLHLTRRDSDANHKSSWYHYLVNKCYLSSDCPQRGCFDCPQFRTQPGSNPSCQSKMKDALHIKAEHFIQTGEANLYRKSADL
jgi:ferredoxin